MISIDLNRLRHLMAFIGIMVGASCFAEVSHTVSFSSGGKTNELSYEDLSTSFDQQTISTKTFWTEGENTFTGPFLKDVLLEVGFREDEKFLVIALDDYVVAFSDWEVMRRHSPILALSMDGKPLPSSFSPYWIVTSVSDLSEPTMKKRYWVWSVARFEAE